MTSFVVVEMTVTSDCAVMSFLEDILSYDQSLCETWIFTQVQVLDTECGCNILEGFHWKRQTYQRQNHALVQIHKDKPYLSGDIYINALKVKTINKPSSGCREGEAETVQTKQIKIRTVRRELKWRLCDIIMSLLAEDMEDLCSSDLHMTSKHYI